MRPLVSWMSRVDTAILEWLSDKGIAAPPKVIFDNVKHKAELSHTQVKRRCLRLNKTGLLFHDPDRGDMYAVTDFGEAYLREEVSKDVLEGVSELESRGEGYKDRGNVTLEDVLRDLKDEDLLDGED